MKLKRILSWIIDWNLCAIPALVYALIFGSIAETQGFNTLDVLMLFFFMLSFPALFVARDVLFKGRSIGKRIFKLHIIDCETNVLPSKQKLIVRNLFFFIYPIEVILLIVTNRSLGDMATNTMTVKK